MDRNNCTEINALKGGIKTCLHLKKTNYCRRLMNRIFLPIDQRLVNQIDWVRKAEEGLTEVECIHVRRVANKFADWLANKEVAMENYDHLLEINVLKEE